MYSKEEEMQKTNMNRREFNTLATSLGLLTFGAPLESILANENVSEEGIKGKKLIVLSLHGGCDTLNAFIPSRKAEYNIYKDLRTIPLQNGEKEISIAIALSDTLALVGNNNIARNNNFRLHPKLSSLIRIWNQGDLAFFPATHCISSEYLKEGKKANRSHFHQIDLFERGGTTGDNVKIYKGWLARYFEQQQKMKMQTQTDKKLLKAFDFHGEGRAFEGNNVPVLALKDPSNIKIGNLAEVLKPELKDKAPSRLEASKNHGELSFNYAKTQDALFRRIVKIQNIKNLDTTYNITKKKSELAKQLKQTATLLRNIKELEIVQLVMGGWDTHKGQMSTQADLFEELSESLKFFYKDLKSKGELDNVVIVVQTEFGRTLKVNGTAGTDHGQASGWFVVGGKVIGGQKGEWKSLTDYDDNERYIKQKTDYRDILGTILEKHMGMDPNDVKNIFGYDEDTTYNQMDFIG